MSYNLILGLVRVVWVEGRLEGKFEWKREKLIGTKRQWACGRAKERMTDEI